MMMTTWKRSGATGSRTRAKLRLPCSGDDQTPQPPPSTTRDAKGIDQSAQRVFPLRSRRAETAATAAHMTAATGLYNEIILLRDTQGLHSFSIISSYDI
jgi:hypothetical protein